MRLRFKSALTFIFLLIIVCVSLEVGYLFYVRVVHEDAYVFVDGNVTINYLNGNEFSLKKDGTLSFSVTNNSSEKAFFYIQLSDVKGDTSNVTYEITSSSNEIELTDTLKSDIISNNISIDGNKTDNYTISFTSKSSEPYSGKVNVRVKQSEDVTFADILIKNNEVKETPTTNLLENATVNEGLIKTTDDLGEDAYYFRGKVENNYVNFAGFTWRIVKINGDGSVKLVLNEITDVLSTYYSEDKRFEKATIKTALEAWYNQNGLIDYADLIANYKFCNDLVYNEATKKYTAYDRILTDKIPTHCCLGSTISSKIGLLTIDEVVFAGASTTANKDYYLYNEEIKTDYFTMTSANESTSYIPFIVKTDGSINYNVDGTLNRGVRPVINIIKNVGVSGDGTKENPYQLITE